MRRMRSTGVDNTSRNEKMPALLTSTSTAMPSPHVHANKSSAASSLAMSQIRLVHRTP